MSRQKISKLRTGSRVLWAAAADVARLSWILGSWEVESVTFAGGRGARRERARHGVGLRPGSRPSWVSSVRSRGKERVAHLALTVLRFPLISDCDTFRSRSLRDRVPGPTFPHSFKLAVPAAPAADLTAPPLSPRGIRHGGVCTVCPRRLRHQAAPSDHCRKSCLTRTSVLPCVRCTLKVACGCKSM